MTLQEFASGIEEIYAIFGKKSPEDKVNEIIYRRVMNLPPEFMTFAVRHFEEQETLPRNMGFYLTKILWPEYLERNPHLKSYEEKQLCPNCLEEMPGFRRVYAKEETAQGVVWVPMEVRCQCGIAPNPRNDPIYSDWDLEKMGLKLKCPYPDVQFMAAKWRKVIGHNEEQRPEHLTTVEEYDSVPF